jgi:hypothetical protein
MKIAMLAAVFLTCWSLTPAQPTPCEADAQDTNATPVRPDTSGFGLGQQSSKPAPEGTQIGATSRPKVVRPNRQGFDLAPKSASQGVQMGAGSRGGEASTIVLYAPNLALTYTLRPLFQWAAQRGNMTFRLYDPDEKQVYEADVSGRDSFLYPQDAPPLKPGDTYRWTVQSKALSVTEPPPSAKFRVISGAQRQQLDQALKPISGDGRAQQMQRAKFFVNHQIWYDAVTVYSRLIADYPNDAKLYQDRAEVYGAIPQTKELASQDLAKAKAGQ